MTYLFDFPHGPKVKHCPPPLLFTLFNVLNMQVKVEDTFLALTSAWLYILCVGFTAWNLPPALAVLLRSDPGGRQEAAVLRRGDGAQTGGHGEQTQS